MRARSQAALCAPARPGGGLKQARVLTPAFATLFLGLLCSIVNLNLFALVPYYLELRGTSERFYGLAGGMLGLGGVGAMALFGSLADRTSRRAAVLRALGVVSVGNLLALGAMDAAPEWYLVAIVLQGVMGGVGLPLVFVWASELSPRERRTEAFAWLGIAGLTGDALGPLLGEALLSTQPVPDSPEAFRAVFVAAILVWPLSVAFFLAAPDAAPPAPDTAERGLAGLLRLPELRLTLIATVAFGGALGVMASLGKNFVASIGLSFVTVLLAAHATGAVLARLCLSWILQRFSPAQLVLRGFFGVAASMVLLALTRGYGLLALSGLVYGVSHGVLFPSLMSRLVDFGGTGTAGRAATLYMGTFSLGMGLWPTLAGFVLGRVGFPPLFLLIALGCVLSALLCRRAEQAHAAPAAP